MSSFFVKDPFSTLEDFSKKFQGVLESIVLDGKNGDEGAYPLMNLRHDENKVEVLVELPGVSKDDIQLDLQELSLTISGERKEDAAFGKAILQERKFGKFKKSVKLPYKVELDQVDAQYKDGLLFVQLVRKAEEKSKSIQIKIV